MKKGKRNTPEALAELIQDEDREARIYEARVARAAHARAARAERLTARRKAKAKVWRAAWRAERWNGRSNAERMKFSEPGWMVLWRRMQPGAWYAWEDLKALMPEYAHGTIRAWPWTKLLPRGMVERTNRPDGERNWNGKGDFYWRRVEGFG